MFITLLISIASLGLGWLIASPLLYGPYRTTAERVPVVLEVFVAIVSGIILNYGIVLLLQSLALVQLATGALAILGLGLFTNHCRRSIPDIHAAEKPMQRMVWLPAALLILVYANLVLTDPIREWDPRSIWFLHAKLIFFAGTMSETAGWLHPSVDWSHPDYPKLVPVIAAQTAHIAGFWNEYLPKASIFLVLLPALLLLCSFAQPTLSFTFLVLALPLSMGEYVWNGYLDGLLGLYFAFALLLVGKFSTGRHPQFLLYSVLCLFMLLYLKNEGQLAVVAALAALVFTQWFSAGTQGHKLIVRSLVSPPSRPWCLPILAVPFVLWSIYKTQWGLRNDLQIASLASLARISERIADGSSWIILQQMIEQIGGALAICTVSVAALYLSRIPLPRETFAIAVASCLYALGILIVYHLTPNDLDWHLNTSVDRTMLPVNGAILVASYVILEHFEKEMKDRHNSVIAPKP